MPNSKSSMSFCVKVETDEMFAIANQWLTEEMNFLKNDKVVIVAGTPPNKEAATNLIRVMKIGEF